MEYKITCRYCDAKFREYAYSATQARMFKCPACKSGYKSLTLVPDTGSKCKDCGVDTKPGVGSARCEECWNDRTL